jgi:uncharacterized protein
MLEHFDFETATVTVDSRTDYGEIRYKAQGLLNNRLHILIFTLRDGNTRAISLRKSNAQERRSYDNV